MTATRTYDDASDFAYLYPNKRRPVVVVSLYERGLASVQAEQARRLVVVSRRVLVIRKRAM